jgi:2',3'-cyclic-nucleotide 2'-phosphodiesterase (5'-nucleotidase family)
MSQLNEADTDRLIVSVPGIDVALYGQNASWKDEAERKGQTICNETGARGQCAGVLRLVIDPQGDVVDFGSGNLALGNLVPKDPVIAKLVSETQDEAKQLHEEVRQARAASSDKTDTSQPHPSPAD